MLVLLWSAWQANIACYAPACNPDLECYISGEVEAIRKMSTDRQDAGLESGVMPALCVLCLCRGVFAEEHTPASTIGLPGKMPG